MFWVFMLLIVVVITVTMIVIGFNYKSNPPEFSENNVKKYTVKLSGKNKDTWLFSQKLFGEIWFSSGIVMLPGSLIIMSTFCKSSMLVVGIAGSLVLFVQSILMNLHFIFVRKALTHNFDKNGKRISK